MWTGDERVFFYNPTTRLSMWERPEELVGRADVDKAIQEPPHKRGLDNSNKLGKGLLYRNGFVAFNVLFNTLYLSYEVFALFDRNDRLCIFDELALEF